MSQATADRTLGGAGGGFAGTGSLGTYYAGPSHAGRVGDDWRLSGIRCVSWAILFVMVLTTLRVLGLAASNTDLFFDEAQYWSWSRDLAAGYYSKPALIAWIIRGATEICGLGEACIRLPSPLLHGATALIVYAFAARLFDPRVGLWACVVYATLPGISFSSYLISTDVPLLLCWALALYALTALLDTRATWAALLLGLAIGLGLNAKYAMFYFLLCLGVAMVFSRRTRRLLTWPRFYLALVIAGAMLIPNLVWNMDNGGATISHTADNANWGGELFHFDQLGEFFLSQFGVFGPILFGGLLVIVVRGLREGLEERDRFLLSFTLPVLLLVMAQAFVSRAHPNWAAVSYVAGAVLLTATMLRRGERGWFSLSMIIAAIVFFLLPLGGWLAGRVESAPINAGYKRVIGWQATADLVRAEIETARRAGRPYEMLLTDDRTLSAEFDYYLRDAGVAFRAWQSRPEPRDHYQLVRPLAGDVAGDILLVSAFPASARNIASAFDRADPLGTVTSRTAGVERTLTMYRLAGFVRRNPWQ